MAVYMERTRNTGGTFGPSGSVPNTGWVQGRGREAQNQPGSTSRISPADIGKINPSSIIDGKGQSYNRDQMTRAIFGAARMFPQLVKLHPWLRFYDLIMLLYQGWRAARLNRMRVKLATNKEGIEVVTDTPNPGSFTQHCSGSPDPAYPFFGGIGYNPGSIGGPGDCGASGQAWPRHLDGPNPTYNSENASEWWWGDFGLAGEKGMITNQWNRPFGTPLEEYVHGPYQKIDSDHLNLRPAGKSIYDAPPTPRSWPSVPNRDPGYNPNNKGYDNPGQPMPGPSIISSGGPPVGRVRQRYREKERKFQLTKDAADRLAKYSKILGNVQGKLADFRDLVEALEKSLPDDLQTKGKSLPDKLANLMRHYDKISPDEAFLGVLEEIAEDLVGGAGDFFKSEAAKKWEISKQKLHLSPRF